MTTSLFAAEEPRKNANHLQQAVRRWSFRRSLRSLRNGGSPVATEGETRAASDSLRQRQALPAALVSLFTPLARRTIPQATTGIFQLDNQEVASLRSNISTLEGEPVKNFHRFEKQKHSTVNPKAFTEKGLYMLATILKSPKAVETTIAIVEAYAKLRELAQVIAEVSQHEDDKSAQQSLMQRGGQLAAELLADNLPIQSSETSVELNLAMFKLKHTVKRENDNEERIARLEAELAELKKERQ